MGFALEGIKMRNILLGLLSLLFGLFTAWAAWQPWYYRFAWARVVADAATRTYGKWGPQVLFTVAGIAFAVFGILVLCGVMPS
jgi:hypothetical protein